MMTRVVAAYKKNGDTLLLDFDFVQSKIDQGIQAEIALRYRANQYRPYNNKSESRLGTNLLRYSEYDDKATLAGEIVSLAMEVMS